MGRTANGSHPVRKGAKNLATLILVRHGQSEWNLANRFTGWWDVDLTEKGVEEARAAGRLLKSRGVLPDLAFTSLQTRAIRTLNLALDKAEDEQALRAALMAACEGGGTDRTLLWELPRRPEPIRMAARISLGLTCTAGVLLLLAAFVAGAETRTTLLIALALIVERCARPSPFCPVRLGKRITLKFSPCASHFI